MDINLKTKLSKRSLIILAEIIGIALCIAIYTFIDIDLNGSFVDWFMGKYMVTHEVYSSEVDGNLFLTEPNWGALKSLILIVFIFIVIFCITVTIAAANIYAKVKVKRTITGTSRMIHDFINTQEDISEIFPKEYAEISVQISQAKAAMQRHEHMLREETTRKNDLIAYLAHDLKTPLTSVIGYLSLLAEEPDMPVNQKAKYTDIALNKALRLEKLINEFFEITRYNIQQIDLEKESIDLHYMLVQMTDEFYPLLHAHQNTTHLDIDENTVIYGDSEKLARVFNNILKNAIAYSYENSTIDIWAEKNETDILIYFRNKGKTIPQQKLNTIFEKFFRLDESRATNTGGAGLGLAIAKDIITLHGGTISASSENELTTFCISLPLDH